MSEFTNRLLLHHEFWKNPSDFGGVKDVDRESLVADLEEAANTIESLQRENDLLREKYLDEKYTAESLRTKIITPEMRERMERAIAMYEAASCIEEYEEWEYVYAIDAFRDRLGEKDA